MTFRSISSSPVIMTWISYLVKFGNAILLIPLVLIHLTAEEVAVWFVFLLVIGLANLADSGFGPSLIRATSYYFAGIEKITPTENFSEAELKKTSINFKGIESLIQTSHILYLMLGLISAGLLLSVGSMIVSNTIEMTKNAQQLWLAFYLLIIHSFFSIQTIKFTAFLQGIDKVAEVKKIETLYESYNILFCITALLIGYGILGLVVVNITTKILLFFASRKQVIQWFHRENKAFPTQMKFSGLFFKSIWPPTWRQGLMYYGSYLTTNGTALIAAQLTNPQLITSYLLTQKVLFFIRQISQAPLYSNLPKIFQMMARKELEELKKFCSARILSGLLLQLSAIILIFLFGNEILELFKKDISIISRPLLSIMSLGIMLELHHAFHAQIYMGSNKVPFLIPSILSGILIIFFSLISAPIYDLWGLILTQFIVQLCINNWYPVFMNLKLLDWRFKDYIFSIATSLRISVLKKSLI